MQSITLYRIKKIIDLTVVLNNKAIDYFLKNATDNYSIELKHVIANISFENFSFGLLSYRKPKIFIYSSYRKLFLKKVLAAVTFVRILMLLITFQNLR